MSAEQKQEAVVKPCPFCGGNPTLHLPHRMLGAWLSCAGCGLEGPTETGVSEQEAIAAWNRRAPAASSQERIAQLEAALRGIAEHDLICLRDPYRIILQTMIDTARAALGAQPAPAPELEGWKPIETAPLDGTRVDLWAYRGECGQLGTREGERYTDCRFARSTFGTEPYGEPRWQGLNDRYITVTPTHWMPLPAAPERIAGAAK